MTIEEKLRNAEICIMGIHKQVLALEVAQARLTNAMVSLSEKLEELEKLQDRIIDKDQTFHEYGR